MKNRREFLKQAVLLGSSTLMLSNSIYAKKLSINNIPSKRAIVIGAGFAGLAAAYKLKNNGWEVVLLESRDRIGGRVFSHKITADNIVELGAEWVGASHERVIELCNDFGLKLNNNQFETNFIYQGKFTKKNTWGYSKVWREKLNSIILEYKKLSSQDRVKYDSYDWWRFLVNNGCEGVDLDLHELIDSTDFGESIRHVSAAAAIEEYAESSPNNEMDFKIEGGNSQLAFRLADKIGHDNILLSHHVAEVQQGEGVKVICTNGKVFEGEKLICSMPTFAMKKVKWFPSLPEDKLDAINELQYARINKHAIAFKDRFWKDEAFDLVTDELPHYFYHATKGQQGDTGTLISYTIGDKAAVIANRPSQHVLDDIRKSLEGQFGDVSSKVINQVNYYWGNDKYSFGAYALYGPGQWYRLRTILSSPFMHTHFAGEHLADWQGFMEGAINTGEDAADQIIG